MHRTLASSAIALLFAVLLAACSSDTTLHLAPDPLPEEGVAGAPGGSGGGGWPGLPPLPKGPWSELDPGEMPDVWFVVAYGDVGCCYGCDGLYGDQYDTADTSDDGAPDEGFDSGADQSEAGFECEVKYAIVDLFGQVIDEFAPPSPSDGFTSFSHLDIQPSGPGRFLATVQGWGDSPIPLEQPGEEPGPEDGPVDYYSWHPWTAFEFDAVARTQSLVAHQDPADYRVLIPETGARVDVGSYGVQAAIDPADAEWLYLWGARYGCQYQPMPLRAANRFKTGVLPRVWGMDEIAGAELAAANWYPSAFGASVDEDGETHLLLGMGDMGCGGGVLPTQVLADFAPGAGTSWTHASSAPWSVNPPSWAPWSGGGTVQIESPWEAPTWHVATPQGEDSGLVGGLNWNVRPGPMLDPSGPTFALIGSSEPYTQGDSISIQHDGGQVWSIDSLRFGLSERQVAILDLIVLPPFGDEVDE